jgi:hypothetical protein
VRHNKIGYFIGLGIILALLALLFPLPAQADAEIIYLRPSKGEIGDWVGTNVFNFECSETVHVYFSSDEAVKGDTIGGMVTAYQHIVEDVTMGTATTFGNCSFRYWYYFVIPDRLTDGEYEEDVHDGSYYVYATYDPDPEIVCVATFTVTGSEIEIDPEEGAVGSEVEISGEGMRPNQKISAEYDGDEVDIISGDIETDGEGQFICAITIPESTTGDHTIAVSDESGDRAEFEFSVEPKINLTPGEQAIGEVVEVSGTGFTEDETITLVIDSIGLDTIPTSLDTNELGSFNCSFIVPFLDSCEVRRIAAEDSDGVRLAETQLAVLPGISLSPTNSPASPGYAGMRLTVRGVGFTAGADVTVTYTINGEAVPVATGRADDSGKLSVGFDVPPSLAGSHTVIASDGITTVSSTFTMESQAPPMPRLLLPEIGGKSEAEAYFRWEDVNDPSGASYTLQVATDANFTSIVLEKEGLLQPEYAVSEGEKLASTKATAPYYWRVRAVDGASNVGDWSSSSLFYVGSSWLSDWLLYVVYGLGILFLALIVVFLVAKFAR